MKKRIMAGLLVLSLLCGTMTEYVFADTDNMNISAENEIEDEVKIVETEQVAYEEMLKKQIASTDYYMYWDGAQNQIFVSFESFGATGKYDYYVENDDQEQVVAKSEYIQDEASVRQLLKIKIADDYNINRDTEFNVVVVDPETGLFIEGKVKPYLSAVKHIVAAIQSDNEVRVSWEDSNSSQVDYKVVAYMNNEQEDVQIYDVKESACVLMNLKKGIAYKVMVIPYTYDDITGLIRMGNSTKSRAIILDQPSLNISYKDCALALSWTKVKDADSYKLFRYNETSKTWNCICETDDLNYTDSNLKAGNTYTYRIQAFSEFGQGMVSKELSARVYAGTSDVAKVNAIADECKVSLTWSAAEEATGYGIYMEDVESGKETTVTMDTYGTSYEVTNLNPDKTYVFYVRSYRKQNGIKIYANRVKSNPVKASIQSVGKITGLKAAADERKVTLSWNNGANSTETIIYRKNEKTGKWDLIAVTKGNSCEIKNLEGGKEIEFAVKPKRWVENWSAQGEMVAIKATPVLITPKAPVKLAATAGECKVNLTWEAGKNAMGYGVYMTDAETGKTTTIAMDVYGSSYEVVNLDPNKKYYFIVRSYRKVDGVKVYGESATTLSVKPAIKQVGEITGLKAAADERRVTLSWNNGANSTETIIYRKNEKTGKWDLIAVTKDNKCLIKDLEGGKEVEFAVKPKRWVGNWSVQGNMIDIKATPILIIPKAPVKLAAVAGECKVNLSWETGKDAMGYGVYMTDVETGKTTTIAMDAYGTAYEVTNLVPNKEYSFTVRSYRKIDGVKIYGESATIQNVKPVIKAVGQITNFKATAGEHQVILSWEGGMNSTETVVYQMNVETGKWQLIASAKTNNYVVKNLPANENVTFAVKPKRWVYQQVYQGEMTSALTAVPTEVIPNIPVDLKAEPGDEEIKLVWPAVSNATGYKIYSYDNLTGQKKFLASTRATNHIVKGLKNGENYSYAILSYRQCDSFMTVSDFSTVVSATPVMAPPAAPASLNVEYKSGSNNLVWPAVDKATGYYVYLYNYNTNKYEELAKVQKNSYVHQGKGKTGKFKYMIKTYREENGQTVVSKNGVEKLVFGADDIKNLNNIIHPMYYSATINQGTRIYDSFSAQEKCGTINAGERVMVIYRRSGRCTIKRNNGSVVYIKTSALNFTAEHYTSNDYTKEQKEVFVNSRGYSSSTKYLIWLNTYTQRVNIFEGSKDNWKLIKNYKCATGAIETPTPPGVRALYEKQKTHKYAHSHYDYLSKFQLENAFHTRIKYYSGGYVDSRLGRPLSHGCVRMYDEEAIYIYKNMPLKTAVIIY